MKPVLVGLVVFTLSAMPMHTARSQTTPLGPGFGYQAQVKQGGMPLNGMCDFQFSLWNDPLYAEPGNQLGVIQALGNVTIENGLFAVELNGGGQFGSNAFQGDARWLQLDVRCPAGGAGNYTLLRPRQKISAVPYAQHTRGLPVDAENSLGVGAAPPGGVRLFLQGTTALDSAAIKSDRGPNYSHVHFGPSGDWYIRSAAAAGKVILQDSGGNVGIGTTNPGRLLQLGDVNLPYSEGMIRLASRSGDGFSQRAWDIGVPQTGENVSGVGYSFIIDDIYRGGDPFGEPEPEFIVRWDTGYVGIGTP